MIRIDKPLCVYVVWDSQTTSLYSGAAALVYMVSDVKQLYVTTI